MGSTAVEVPVGATARVRMINADNGPRLVTASVPFRVVAIDGTDVEGGGELTDTFVDLPGRGTRRPLGAGHCDRHAGRACWAAPRWSSAGPVLDAPSVAARVRFDALGYGTPGRAHSGRAPLSDP